MNNEFERVSPGVLDPRTRRYLLPSRIVWQTEGKARPLGSKGLLEDGGVSCHLNYKDDVPGLLLDFGREIHGGVQLTNGITPSHAPVAVRVRFGESVAEAMGEPNQDHAIHNQTVLVPWYGSAEVGNTGFRYVRLDLVEPGSQLVLEGIRAVFLNRDLEYKGAFRCNDERLNRIWDVGAYTVHLCMQDMLWDGIKRDRLVWIGDMHPETMVVNTVFGECDVVPKSLDYVRDDTPLPRWMNGISSYSIWWVRIQRCWYLYHGNRAYLEAQRDYLKGLLRQLLAQIGDGGREQMGKGRFLDWPSSEDGAAIHAGLQALLTLGLEDGAALCAELGEADLAAECRAGAARLRAYTPPATPSKQAHALCALAGLRDAAETNREVLAQEPLRGISTFYGYYVLQARAAAGDYAGAMEVIRTYWGAMLDLGATTFWEDFDLAWTEGAVGLNDLVPEGAISIHANFGNYCYKGLRHSLCHGWAAGPTAWLTEHVLGVRPLSPGSKTLLIQPHLAGLEFAEGRFPTPEGVVTVSHKRDASGKVTSEWDAPPGIEVQSETA